MKSNIHTKICGVLCAVVVLSGHAAADGDSKIVGGSEVSLKTVPFATSLQYQGMHFCGGALLTLSHVLTGCHCLTSIQKGMKHQDVQLRDTRLLTAVVGTENLFASSDYLQSRKIQGIKIHPNCSFVQIMVYDFAVAYLERPVQENVKVKPFKMISVNKEEYDRKTKYLVNNDKSSCHVAGWGAVDPTVLKANPFIKAARMRIIPDEQCQQRLGQENVKFLVHDFGDSAMMCSLPYRRRKNESDCSGDSGGPFYCGPVVYGIVSFGYDCGNWDSPNVYAKVSNAVDWLISLDIFPTNSSENERSLKGRSPNYKQPRSITTIVLLVLAPFVAIKVM